MRRDIGHFWACESRPCWYGPLRTGLNTSMVVRSMSVACRKVQNSAHCFRKYIQVPPRHHTSRERHELFVDSSSQNWAVDVLQAAVRCHGLVLTCCVGERYWLPIANVFDEFGLILYVRLLWILVVGSLRMLIVARR